MLNSLLDTGEEKISKLEGRSQEITQKSASAERSGEERVCKLEIQFKKYRNREGPIDIKRAFTTFWALCFALRTKQQSKPLQLFPFQIYNSDGEIQNKQILTHNSLEIQ